MRLWRYKTTDSNSLPSYKDLLTYVTETFEFTDIKQFRITFKDDDNEQITMTCQEDFKDAFTQNSNKKSLKLYVIDTAEPHRHSHYIEQKESVESKQPIETPINNNNNASEAVTEPTEEEINAFLSDDLTMDLLSDLFISVFEALQAANFEISFIETVEGIILSSNDKYNKLISSPIWPYFMKQLLPNISYKIETFMIPMIKMNGINTEMIKQWIPTMFTMMKYHTKNNNKCGRGWRGNKPWKRWRGRGRRGWRGRGHHYHRHGHGYGHGYGYGHGHGHGYNHNGHHGHHGHHGHFQPNFGYETYEVNQQPPQQQQQQQNDDDQMEQEVFMYTEELVEIMNMGFTNMNDIKELLNEYKGNKQMVVQQLVEIMNMGFTNM